MAPNDRQERRAARERGAGYRELKNANFGFTFGSQNPEPPRHTPRQSARKQPAKSTAKKSTAKKAKGRKSTAPTTNDAREDAPEPSGTTTGSATTGSNVSQAITPAPAGKRKRGSMAPPPVPSNAETVDELEPTAEELAASARKTGSAEARRSRRSSIPDLPTGFGMEGDELETDAPEHLVMSANTARSVRMRQSILQPPIHFAPPTSQRRRAPLAQMTTPDVNALSRPVSRDSNYGNAGDSSVGLLSLTPGMAKGKAVAQMQEQAESSMLHGADVPRTPAAITAQRNTGLTPNGVPTRLIDPQLLSLAANRAHANVDESLQSLIDEFQPDDAGSGNMDDSTISAGPSTAAVRKLTKKDKGKRRAVDSQSQANSRTEDLQGKKSKKRKSGGFNAAAASAQLAKKRRLQDNEPPSSSYQAASTSRTNHDTRDSSRGRSRVPRSPVSRPPLATKSTNTAISKSKPQSQKTTRTQRPSPAPEGRIPITIYRLSRPRPSAYLSHNLDASTTTAGEEDEEDDPLTSTAPPPSRLPGVNAIDVLSQIITELIDAYSSHLLNQHRALSNSQATQSQQGAKNQAQRTLLKRQALAVNLFARHLSDTLFTLSTSLDANAELEGRVRVMNKEKARLRNELMRVRKEREEVALQIDRVRREALQRREAAEAESGLNARMWDVELAVRRGRESGAVLGEEDRELDVEEIVKEIGGEVLGETGLFGRVKSVCEVLEGRARVLEGRA